jgi:hypothetical protein
MKTNEVLRQIALLEEQVSTLENEITQIVSNSYMDALREHTSMNESQIKKAWLNYNAVNDNLEL